MEATIFNIMFKAVFYSQYHIPKYYLIMLNGICQLTRAFHHEQCEQIKGFQKQILNNENKRLLQYG